MTAVPFQRDLTPSVLSEPEVKQQFTDALSRGATLRPQGSAKNNPSILLRRHAPKHLIDLEGHQYYLTEVRRDQQFRFFVGYVRLKSTDPENPDHAIYPRIFYKDSSLVWRVATHYIDSEHEHWIGKGDIKPTLENGETVWYSAEETTNLPFEIQTAMDLVSRRSSKPRPDRQALSLILRNAPDDRVRPYADFTRPRKEAMANAKKCINNNKPIAWFKFDNDPRSLKFERGYVPDFDEGLIAASSSRSKLYGGAILRFRIASKNRKVQYLFMRAPAQSWIIPPQPMALNLMNFGVHTVDALVDENLCIPGYEYHFPDESEAEGVFSQIPKGYAGSASSIDPQRADASPWTHNMPVIRQFHAALPDLVKRARF